MKEIKDIVQAFDEATRLHKKAALATVVHVEGSSYRRPGARMLVTEDGQLTGAISGGCLEGDALRKAVLAITQEKNKLVVYDTTDEDDAKLGIQLGCNGIVSILFEPIDGASVSHPIHILRKAIVERKPAVMVTGYSLNNGEHFGTRELSAFPASMQNEMRIQIQNAFEAQSSMHIIFNEEENRQQFFIAYHQPAISLVIAGAGNDAQPLATMAHNLGWQVTVVDGRITHANKQRFPLADQIICAKPIDACRQLLTDQRTAMVLVTHNYNYDLEMLKELNPADIAYIGLLGPASKRIRMLEELAQKGVQFTSEQMEKIYGPTGLDLGAETAEEIALSIAAEIMSVVQRKEACNLRNKERAIHSETL
ncbi:MAG: XdhC/CoxI family protein [Bacteroidota bacterium]